MTSVAYSLVGEVRRTSVRWVGKKPRHCIGEETARDVWHHTDGEHDGKAGFKQGPAYRQSKIFIRTTTYSISTNLPRFTTGASGDQIVRTRRKRTTGSKPGSGPHHTESSNT